MTSSKIVEADQDTYNSPVPCTICQGTIFGAGPGGRKATTGKLPRCLNCNSLERHRLIRKVWECFPSQVLKMMDILQLSADMAVDKNWFNSYELSIYKKWNSLDLEKIQRPDDSYDAVVCNHVLEHVPEDRLAFRELHRIIKPDGFLQFTVPNPAIRSNTVEWGYADLQQHGHYRVYGYDDLLPRFKEALEGVHILEIKSTDDVTCFDDYVYFSSMSSSVIDNLKQYIFDK